MSNETKGDAARLLSAQIAALSPPDRLRLAADLLDASAKEGGNTRTTGLAHTIAESVTVELGAALALHELKRRTG